MQGGSKLNTLNVTYRNIAKMLTSSLPVDGQEYSHKVEEYLQIIKSLPQAQKIALKSAYIFSRKVPKFEREDLFQDLTLELLKAQITDERLAYTVARCDWQDWWKRYTIRQHYSLDKTVMDAEGNQVPFSELLVGEIEWERKIDGDLDGLALWEKLPKWVQELVNKRLTGKGIRGGDRKLLNNWVASKPLMLASYQQ